MSDGDSLGRWVNERPPPGSRRVRFAFIWKVASIDERVHLLNVSRSVDAITKDYLDLARLIELAAVLPWHKIPRELQGLLEGETVCYYAGYATTGPGVYVEFI